MRAHSWLLMAAILLPAAQAAGTGYASSFSACSILGVAPVLRIAPCPITLDQTGTLDVVACSGPEPAMCGVNVSGSAVGSALPGPARDLRVLVDDPAGPAPAAQLCQASLAAGSTPTTIACGGSATLRVPLAVGTCMEIRVRAELTQVASPARAIMGQTEAAFHLCRAANGSVSAAPA